MTEKLSEKFVSLLIKYRIKYDDVWQFEKEIKRLESENEKLRWYHLGSIGQIDLLSGIGELQKVKSKLAEVEKLIGIWRNRKIRFGGKMVTNPVRDECADELEEVLEK